MGAQNVQKKKKRNLWKGRGRGIGGVWGSQPLPVVRGGGAKVSFCTEGGERGREGQPDPARVTEPQCSVFHAWKQCGGVSPDTRCWEQKDGGGSFAFTPCTCVFWRHLPEPLLETEGRTSWIFLGLL